MNAGNRDAIMASNKTIAPVRSTSGDMRICFDTFSSLSDPGNLPTIPTDHQTVLMRGEGGMRCVHDPTISWGASGRRPARAGMLARMPRLGGRLEIVPSHKKYLKGRATLKTLERGCPWNASAVSAQTLSSATRSGKSVGETPKLAAKTVQPDARWPRRGHR